MTSSRVFEGKIDILVFCEFFRPCRVVRPAGQANTVLTTHIFPVNDGFGETDVISR